MPAGAKHLIGLGLKYCIKRARPTKNIVKSIERFNNNVRRIAFFKFNPKENDDNNNDDYIPGLTIPSGFTFDYSTTEIEKCLANFERDLYHECTRYL